MRITALTLMSIPLIVIGTALSYPRIAARSQSAAHEQIALERIASCFVVHDGAINEGYFYAHLLDPSRKWDRLGKPTIEGDLLAGKNQFLCDVFGKTASVGNNGVAENLRSLPADRMRTLLSKRFSGNEVHHSLLVTQSTIYRPDFNRRLKEKLAKDKEVKKTKEF